MFLAVDSIMLLSVNYSNILSRATPPCSESDQSLDYLEGIIEGNLVLL